MGKDNKAVVAAAWITGGLGCAGVILLVIGSIIAALIQKNSSKPTEANPNPIIVIVPTSQPAAITVMPTDPQNTSPRTTLRVINDTSDYICFLYIVPVGSETWGNDWLGEEEMIDPNQALTFTVETGMYHLHAENCDYKLIEESLDQHIQGDMHWVVGP